MFFNLGDSKLFANNNEQQNTLNIIQQFSHNMYGIYWCKVYNKLPEHMKDERSLQV